MGGNGTEYDILETGTSEMFVSGKDFPRQLRKMDFHESVPKQNYFFLLSLKLNMFSILL